jgi:ubiquitin-conjugating enzyme E2 J2
MLESTPTTGSIVTTDQEKRRLAAQSLTYNKNNPTFRKLFPQFLSPELETQTVETQPQKQSEQNTTQDSGSSMCIILMFLTLMLVLFANWIL